MTMTIIKNLCTATILGSFLFTSSAFAYNAGHTDEKCKIPKIRNYSPAKHKKGEPVPEIEAEGTIGFWVSYTADPTTIKAVAKKIYKLKLTVDDRKPYYRVTAKLPVELNGKYARVDIKADAKTGECEGKDGFLIKINKPVEQAEQAAE